MTGDTERAAPPPAKAPEKGLPACWGKAQLGTERCQKPGVFEPTVWVWERAWQSDKKAAKFRMVGMAFCPECHQAATLADVADVKTQAQIDANFKASGKPIPNWTTAKIHWNELAVAGGLSA